MGWGMVGRDLVVVGMGGGLALLGGVCVEGV